MSIQQVQTQNLLELVSRAFLSGGQSPLLDDIYKYLNKFFAANPPGQPFQVPQEILTQEDLKSDPEFMNAMMAVLIANTDVLYETCMNHVDQVMMLNTVLRNHLNRLQIKRNILNSQIDDYLLGIYNSDGYFYSYSDNFSTLSGADMAYTNAFIDTATGAVMLPAVSSKSRLINPDALWAHNMSASDGEGNALTIEAKSRMQDALDGLNNTSWLLEVKTEKPGPIEATVEINFSDAYGKNLVTRIDIDPHTVTPIQYAITATYGDGAQRITEPFTKHVKTTMVRRSYVPSQVRPHMRKLAFQMKKEKHDYEINNARERTLVYMFGFKELMISEQYFDPDARFVSNPIAIPESMGGDAVIDAVSVVLDDTIPNGTDIVYYVAADKEGVTSLQDFNWIRIEPLSDLVNSDSQIVRFDSTTQFFKNIRSEPQNSTDLQLIDLNSTNVDLTRRNPTTSYFPGLSVYRISLFNEPYILNSLKLEEGFNTTRIYYTTLETGTIAQGFNYWQEIFEDPTSYTLTHGEIDTGHGFLYGGDISENGVGVYSETYIYVDQELPVMLKECRKPDSNSKTWAVKVFLNGREIANLPVGTDKITVPWQFRQGKNHVVVMAEIPNVTPGTSAPYIGFFEVMANTNLSDYGVVKLDDWVYVDPFKFEKNLTPDSRAFTIYNNEIVSRRKPTDNFRITYNKVEASAPEAIRFRADFTRTGSFANVTPALDFYRLRFSYNSST